MFKLSHHIRGLSLFRPRTGEEFFFLDKKCASCFLQCFSLRLLTKWLPLWPSFNRPPHQTLDTSLTSKHLQTFCSESTPPLDCLVFLIFGILWLFFFFFVGNLHTMARHDFKSVSCLLRNNPICQLHCLDRQGGIWIPLFLALCSEYTSARFQRVVVYYPVSVWQRCLPAFYTSLSIRGYDAVFGSPPLYNLSEANSCHTSPHVLFMANMFPVNDSKYTSGCEEWFGKLPHTCHHHPPRLAR